RVHVLTNIYESATNWDSSSYFIPDISLPTIRKGIYSMNGYNPQNPNRLVVAVHPYCFGYDPSEVSFRDDHQDYLTYLPRLERLVQQHKGPLVTLESGGRIERTADKYRALGRMDDSYFIMSWPAGPSPIEFGDRWEEVARFLKEFDTSQTICLVGGELMDPDVWGFQNPGCLGSTFRNLRKEGLPVEILRKVTFS
ncbi:MAG: hypothetical protein AABX14_04560, partial [Candidatus Aenigmatarchaeota archaeon]